MLFAAIVIGTAIFVLIRMFQRNRRYGYKPITYLNSKAEQNFLIQLKRKLPQNLSVMCKVRLADLCLPTNGRNRIVAFNKISRKHVDFVLIDTTTSRIVTAIELDDKSHGSYEAQKRDNEKNYALASARIPLHRVKVTRNYTRQIESILSKSLVQTQSIDLAVTTQKCPRCEHSMKLITMKLMQRGKGYYLCDNCQFETPVATLNRGERVA